MIVQIASYLSDIQIYLDYFLIVFFLLYQIFFYHKLKIKHLIYGNIFLIIFLILIAFLFSTFNYYTWKLDPISKQLLPPYAPLSYVLHYSWQHYWAAPIVTILFALIIFWGIKKLNKKFNETFFYDEEPYLAVLGILATGWPNCLIYLSLVLFLGVIFHLIRIITILLRRKFKVVRMIQGRDINVSSIKGEVLEAPPLQMSTSLNFRLSLLYFWLPCALLVLLLSGIISKYLIINQLTI